MDPNLIWEASVEEIERGYALREGACQCLICGRKFEQGEVFADEGRYFDAQAMAARHVRTAHGSMLRWLLEREPELLGISNAQQTVLRMMADGLTDREIAEQKGISPSTCRNHRYKLREKQRQAKLFLAAMELMSAQNGAPEFHDAHPTATMLDDRYNVTEAERRKIIATYFDENGALKECPAREKKKIVVLAVIAQNFLSDRSYSEKEVNRILGRIYADHAYIRRLLIEYGFLERTRSGSEYWRCGTQSARNP